LFRQHVALEGQPEVLPQALPTWAGSSSKGSGGATATEHVDVQATSTLPLQRSGAVSLHV
jgi:hypothetical protein